MRSKIGLNDTVQDTLIKLSEGNPGALSVCMQIMAKGSQIDPDAFGGGLLMLLSLDDLGIYGSRIWMLYKDVCGTDLTDTLGVLRGHQLGFITSGTLNHAIDNRGDGLDIEDVVSKVRERLPDFGKMGGGM